MKLLALDIGDVWTGMAISDPLGIIAKPYKTVTTKKLIPELRMIIEQEHIEHIVVGHPKTMRGRQSEQTKKTEDAAKTLQENFPNTMIILWDERLSSKRASALKSAKSQENKQAEHAIAAAFILSSYLDFIRIHMQEQQP